MSVLHKFYKEQGKIKKEDTKVHVLVYNCVIDIQLQVSSYQKSSLDTCIIGHPLDCTPITWQIIGAGEPIVIEKFVTDTIIRIKN